MADRRQGLRPTLFLVVLTMIATTGAVWLALNSSVREARALADQVERLRREVADLEQRHAELLALREGLERDPLVIEREMRRTLGLVRPGEAVIVDPIPPAPPPPEAPVPSALDWLRLAIYAVVGLLALSIPLLLIASARPTPPVNQENA